ncbi:hypothetical protein K491DRAFT_767645 [Lophiostoma macrostomum CBS 122681]|uniref:Transcription factor domain-containing protein n=1 Tax=Lophiostoma macrostomum CBS 122681 TaxID=1314788 RepID=A0A6A6T9B0_9PLEO|nr:hypothetical protein K491DRAFT_767645 [Lophiostoma macrostomum CBS 122681]
MQSNRYLVSYLLRQIWILEERNQGRENGDVLLRHAMLAIRQKHEDLRKKQTAHEELFDLLKTMPETDAMDVLHRIRAGGDAQDILNHVKEGNLLMQLSLVPENRRRYELPRSRDMPAFTLVPSNAYLASLIYGTTFRVSDTRNSSSLLSDPNAYEDYSPYPKPYHAAEMADSLLQKAIPSQWTAVSSDNEFLRQLLSAYFMHQHLSHFYFHKDLFIEDLADGRTKFCYRLLVNAVLAAGCQSLSQIPDRYKFWLPHNLGYRFLAEAKRLWETETFDGKSRITTAQAACVLNNITDLNGMDKVRAFYYREALAMMKRMNLFNAHVEGESKRAFKGRLFTAWAFFSWSMMNTYHFFQPPDIRDPPITPLPGPVRFPEWYGEAWLQYGNSGRQRPVHLGCIMQTRCALHRIMNDIGYSTFREDKESPDQPPISLSQALEFKAQLETCFTFSTEYHKTIATLFQPHLSTSVLAPNEAQNPSAHILHDARIALETLLRLYYLRHTFDSLNSMLFPIITLTYGLAIGDLNHSSFDFIPRDALHSTLILSAKYMESQGRCYYLANLVRLAMKSRMRAEDV